MINVTCDYTTNHKTYPYLGDYDGIIVLFTGVKKGVCLQCPKEPNRIGETHDYWEEHKFSVIEGTITISNK